MNRCLMEAICGFLGIQTRFRWSWEFSLGEGKTDRLVDLCSQLNATQYVSGPAARSYLDQRAFSDRGIEVRWFDYAGYPEYEQMWGAFEHAVTVLDLLFHCGKEAPRYMKFGFNR